MSAVSQVFLSVDPKALHIEFALTPHFHCMSGILVVGLPNALDPHPQSAAVRLPGRDVNVDAHAEHAPPFAP